MTCWMLAGTPQQGVFQQASVLKCTNFCVCDAMRVPYGCRSQSLTHTCLEAWVWLQEALMCPAVGHCICTSECDGGAAAWGRLPCCDCWQLAGTPPVWTTLIFLFISLFLTPSFVL